MISPRVYIFVVAWLILDSCSYKTTFSPWQETGIQVNKDFDTCIKVTMEFNDVNPSDSLIEQFEYNTESIYIRGIWGGIVNGGRKLTLSSCYKSQFGFYHSLQIAKLDSIHGVEWNQVESYLDNP